MEAFDFYAFYMKGLENPLPTTSDLEFAALEALKFDTYSSQPSAVAKMIEIRMIFNYLLHNTFIRLTQIKVDHTHYETVSRLQRRLTSLKRRRSLRGSLVPAHQKGSFALFYGYSAALPHAELRFASG